MAEFEGNLSLLATVALEFNSSPAHSLTESRNTTLPIIYYSLLYRLVGTISLAIILVTGLVGNLLVVLVIVVSPGLHTATNCYLVSLSASDLLVLLSAVTLMLKELYRPFAHWDLGRPACQLSVCLQYLTADVSAMSICAFSVERWVAICYPIRAHQMCTVRRALRIIIGIWLFGAVYNIPWMFIATTVRTNSTLGDYDVCTFRYQRTAYKAVFFCDIVIYYVLPLCITAVLYAHIGWRLFRSPGETGPQPPQGSQVAKTVPNFVVSLAVGNGSRSQVRFGQRGLLLPQNASQQALQVWRAMHRIRSRKQVIKILMLIVILFACCWLPYRVMVLANSFQHHRQHDLWLLLFAKVMAYLNSAVNPILYNVMSKKFRRALKRLFKRSELTSWLKIIG